MSYNWGPYYIIPSKAIGSYSGLVKLRETFDEDLLQNELQALGLTGPIVNISNPWYYRSKDSDTWIKVGESDNRAENFAVSWDTRGLENGQYEVLGLMHVFVKHNGGVKAIARQNIVEVVITN